MKKQLLAVAAAAAIMIGGGVATAVPASAASLNGSVKGHIKTVDGKALTGANVLVSRVGESNVLKTKVTSKTGRFEMALKPGAYTLVASDPKDKYATSTFATTFTIETGKADRVNKRLSLASSITGRVTTDGGVRIPGVTVTATGKNSAGVALPVETLTTDSTGAFRFRGLTAGSYILKYEKADLLTEYFGGGTGTPISLAVGQKLTGKGVTLASEAKITGRVTVNGIEASTELGGVVATLTNKATGVVVETQPAVPTFKFGGLQPGTYTLSFAGAAGITYIPATTYASDIVVTGGQAVSGLVQPITTTPGSVLPTKTTATITPASIPVGTDFTVSVKTISYAALAGVPATVTFNSVESAPTNLDANGVATFTVSSVGALPGNAAGVLVTAKATPATPTTTGTAESTVTVYPVIVTP